MMSRDAKLIALEQRPVGRLLAEYSLPAVIGMAAMSLYNLVDAVYIGQFCGAYAIAAMALVFPIMNLTIAFGTLIGLGSAATASIALGQQDFNRAFRVLGHCVMLGLIGGVIIGWLPLLWMEPILRLFGATDTTLQPAADFMLVIMLGFPLSSSFMNLNHLMRASGYPGKAMVSLLISMVVNIAGAHLFIYMLDWGMIGAGLATIAAQFVGILWVLHHFLKRGSVLHFCTGIYKLCGPITRRIMTVGLPPCLLNAAGCVVVVLFNYMLLRYEGEMGVGAFGIINRVVFLFVMVVLGITQGMQPIAGYNLGLGNYRRVKHVLYCAMAAGTVVTLFGWLSLRLCPEFIVSFFARESDANSARLIALATEGVRLLTIAFPLVGSQIVIGNFFQAIGRPAMSIFLNLSRQFLMLIPALLLLPPYLGGRGIWLAQGVADTLSAVLGFAVLYLFLTRVFRKHHHFTTDN